MLEEGDPPGSGNRDDDAVGEIHRADPCTLDHQVTGRNLGVRAMKQLAKAEAVARATVTGLERIREITSEDFVPVCNTWHTKIYDTDGEGVTTLARGPRTGGGHLKRVRGKEGSGNKKEANVPVNQPSVVPCAVTQETMLTDMQTGGGGCALRHTDG